MPLLLDCPPVPGIATVKRYRMLLALHIFSEMSLEVTDHNWFDCIFSPFCPCIYPTLLLQLVPFLRLLPERGENAHLFPRLQEAALEWGIHPSHVSAACSAVATPQPVLPPFLFNLLCLQLYRHNCGSTDPSPTPPKTFICLSFLSHTGGKKHLTG